MTCMMMMIIIRNGCTLLPMDDESSTFSHKAVVAAYCESKILLTKRSWVRPVLFYYHVFLLRFLVPLNGYGPQNGSVSRYYARGRF